MKIVSALNVILILVIVTGCAATAPQNNTLSDVAGRTAINSLGGQTSALGTAANMAGGLNGLGNAVNQNPALVGILAQQLGISPYQAMGGAGSIFSAAKGMMSPANFGLVSKAVPGMPQLLAAAPRLSVGAYHSGGLLGNALGGSNLGQMAMLANSFQSLGLRSDMINQFIPVILNYVQTQGGPSTMSLLQSALLP